MSAMKKPVLILLGLVLLLFSSRALSLVFAGDMGEGVIDQARLKLVQSQSKGGRHSNGQLTGKYILKTEVVYHFDIYPTPSEALKRASEEPIKTGITGKDILSDTSSSSDPKYRPGDEVTILYLRPIPQINAAYQPNNLKFYGFGELLFAVVLLTWGLLINRKAQGTAPSPNI